MSLEWFHVVLGVFFVGIWLIAGQIVALDRQEVRGSSPNGHSGRGARKQATTPHGDVGLHYK
ncbi:MAG: hypothetical protein KF752_05505 [Pirellulaceae bacterium]|nr:hypothetical protein [Pirellulaceae bacterium]